MKITNLLQFKDEYELKFIDNDGEETYASFLTDEKTRFNVFEIGVSKAEFNDYKKKITEYLLTNFKQLKKQYGCKKQKEDNIMNYIYYKDYKIEAVYDSNHCALYPVISYKHNGEVVYDGEFDFMLFHENDVFSEGARIIESNFINV